jgi:hypothetical protein
MKCSRHLKRVAGESTRKTYECPQCDYKSPDWGNMKKHKATHKFGRERLVVRALDDLAAPVLEEIV